MENISITDKIIKLRTIKPNDNIIITVFNCINTGIPIPEKMIATINVIYDTEYVRYRRLCKIDPSLEVWVKPTIKKPKMPKKERTPHTIKLMESIKKKIEFYKELPMLELG